MDLGSRLESLLTVAEEIGIDVRVEPMGGEGGGLCVLKGQRVLFVDVSADLATRYDRTVAAMAMPGTEILAWLGPCIGADRFEIGPEVRDALVAGDPGADGCVRPGRADRWHADLQALARRRLMALGIESVTAAAACTFSDSRRFFSHRREAPCGRMATLIWLEAGSTHA